MRKSDRGVAEPAGSDGGLRRRRGFASAPHRQAHGPWRKGADGGVRGAHGPRTSANASLFETTAPTSEETIGSFTTSKQFSLLAPEFFSRLTRKYLTYFLSHDLSNYFGVHGRFTNIDGHAQFNSALDLHCRQASRIVEESSGDWFAKGNFVGPITQKMAGGHVYGFRHQACACARTPLLRHARR